MRLADLNAMGGEAATAALLQCCGSSRWARGMASARPFRDRGEMAATADAMSAALSREDWLEAFAAHPKIGTGKAEKADGAGQAGKAGGWSDEEQAGVAGAAAETMRRLADANREYEARFGFIFIVCASGKSAAEMLSLLEGRLRHDADEELPVAAEEQRRITQLRLAKLLEQEPESPS